MLHNMTFSERLNLSEVKYLHFLADFNAFKAFNPVKFTDEFMTNYRKAIDDCFAFIDDESVVDEGQERTQTVQELMEEARRLYKRVKYFIEEAYEKNEARKNRFSLDNYEGARKSPVNMVAFLTLLHKQTKTFQEDLVKVGLSSAKIDAILTLRNQLQTANASQKSFSGERQETTQTRASLFELMDSFTQAVCKAGKIIFDGNMAKFRQYSVYKTPATTDESKKVIAASSTEVAENFTENPITDSTAFKIENVGNVALSFYTNEVLSDAVSASALKLKANSSQEITAAEMKGTSLKLLIVKNESTSQGKYRITKLEALEE